MPDDNQPREDATQPIADPALVEDAEVAAAEAAEAEALAVAAQARARAIRLRQQADSAAMARTRQRDSAESSVDSEEADEPAINAEVTGAASADSPDADEAAERPAGTESPRRRLTKPRPATVISGAAVALVCALLGASVLIAVQHHGAVQRRQSAAAFIAAAKQGVINMTSLNFQNVEEDIQRVLDNSTGEFRDDFERQAADFTEVTKQAHVVSEGTVNLAAIESMERDSAVVLVAATSRVTNSAGAKAEPRTWRLRVTVSRDGDQLKMSKLVYVP